MAGAVNGCGGEDLKVFHGPGEFLDLAGEVRRVGEAGQCELARRRRPRCSQQLKTRSHRTGHTAVQSQRCGDG
ncbi:hypothetical protein [Arthrobacter rhizosphaerae]|uniref:hypothetical protein n=1 Tax=Arthrobacter rhizosphaerae TaxID=2855490 RepID=UPI001FF68D23|nr:hypothetical protein [Arthrobacter rhizosphaerae]